MKRILFSIALVVLMATVGSSQTQDQDRNQDRIMLVDGDVLQIRDRDQVRLKDKVTLNDGTIINPNGSYQTSDGKKLRLRDGECLDMNGVKYTNEYQYRQRIQKENKNLSEAQIREKKPEQNSIYALKRNSISSTKSISK